MVKSFNLITSFLVIILKELSFDSILDVVHKEAENCDCLQGLMLVLGIFGVSTRRHKKKGKSSDKEEPDAEAVASMLGFQSYWDSTYADEFANFREYGHAGEAWFGTDVMETVASWTKSLCTDLSQGHLLNHVDNNTAEHVEHGDKDLSSWNMLDIGTGNGLLLQELAKQGWFC